MTFHTADDRKIDVDGLSLTISCDSHLLIQIMELLFICLSFYLFCLALAFFKDLYLVVKVAQTYNRIDLFRTEET